MSTRTREISNSDDIIDSRDIIARIDALESEIADASPDDDVEDAKAELTTLKALADEAESSPDWRYGETLIRDSYFVEYAEQLADDIGAIDRNASWPGNCIDWEKAADQLKADYFSVDYDGVEYWIRG